LQVFIENESILLKFVPPRGKFTQFFKKQICQVDGHFRVDL